MKTTSSEKSLEEIRANIELLRSKAAAFRRKADAADAEADAMRRVAAQLQTPLLEEIANPLKEGQDLPRFTGP